MAASQSNIDSISSCTTTSAITSKEHYDHARQLVETIENKVGYSEGLISSGPNSDFVCTIDNSLLAIIKYFTGDVDSAKRIMQTIEDKIGYESGLIRHCAPLQKRERITGDENIFFALGFSIIGEAQKAAGIFSCVENKVADDLNTHEPIHCFFSSYGNEQFGWLFFYYPEAYLFLAEYFTGDTIKAKANLKTLEDYFAKRRKLGFDEPESLIEHNKRQALQIKKSYSSFAWALLAIVHYVMGRTDMSGKEVKKITDYFEEEGIICYYHKFDAWHASEKAHLGEKARLYFTKESLIVAIAHLALSGVMDNHINHISMPRLIKARKLAAEKEEKARRLRRLAEEKAEEKERELTLAERVAFRLIDVSIPTEKFEEFVYNSSCNLKNAADIIKYISFGVRYLLNKSKPLRLREVWYKRGILAEINKDITAIEYYIKANRLEDAARLMVKVGEYRLCVLADTYKADKLFRSARILYSLAGLVGKAADLDFVIGDHKKVEERKKWLDRASVAEGEGNIEQAISFYEKANSPAYAVRLIKNLIENNHNTSDVEDTSSAKNADDSSAEHGGNSPELKTMHKKLITLCLAAGEGEEAAQAAIKIGNLKLASAIYQRYRCFEEAVKLEEQIGNKPRAEELFERAFLEYELFAEATGKSRTGIVMFGGVGIYRLASERVASEHGWDRERIAKIYERKGISSEESAKRAAMFSLPKSI